MGVSGDFAQLAALQRNMRRLAGVDVRVAREVAPKLSDLARASFDAGQSPYGEGWPATKTQGARRLNDTGALRASATTLTPQGRKLVGELVPYGRYQRPPLFLPKGSAIPPSWSAEIEAEVPRTVQAIMGGR